MICVAIYQAADEVDSVAMDDVYMTGIVRWYVQETKLKLFKLKSKI